MAGTRRNPKPWNHNMDNYEPNEEKIYIDYADPVSWRPCCTKMKIPLDSVQAWIDAHRSIYPDSVQGVSWTTDEHTQTVELLAPCPDNKKLAIKFCRTSGVITVQGSYMTLWELKDLPQVQNELTTRRSPRVLPEQLVAKRQSMCAELRMELQKSFAEDSSLEVEVTHNDINLEVEPALFKALENDSSFHDATADVTSAAPASPTSPPAMIRPENVQSPPPASVPFSSQAASVSTPSSHAARVSAPSSLTASVSSPVLTQERNRPLPDSAALNKLTHVEGARQNNSTPIQGSSTPSSPGGRTTTFTTDCTISPVSSVPSQLWADPLDRAKENLDVLMACADLEVESRPHRSLGTLAFGATDTPSSPPRPHATVTVPVSRDSASTASSDLLSQTNPLPANSTADSNTSVIKTPDPATRSASASPEPSRSSVLMTSSNPVTLPGGAATISSGLPPHGPPPQAPPPRGPPPQNSFPQQPADATRSHGPSPQGLTLPGPPPPPPPGRAQHFQFGPLPPRLYNTALPPHGPCPPHGPLPNYHSVFPPNPHEATNGAIRVLQNQLNVMQNDVQLLHQKLDTMHAEASSNYVKSDMIFDTINAYVDRPPCAPCSHAHQPQQVDSASASQPQLKNLKLGSSLFRDLNDKDMINTTVVAKSGGTPEDFIRILKAKVKDNERYNSVDILGGGNAIAPKSPKREPKPPQEVAKEMKEVVTLAKQLSPNVRVVELPPRQITPDIATKVIELNEELDKLCEELQVPFVNIAGKFYTADGNVNAALLDDDKIHLSPHGSAAMVELLQIKLISADVKGVAPFAAYKNSKQPKAKGKSPKTTQEKIPPKKQHPKAKAQVPANSGGRARTNTFQNPPPHRQTPPTQQQKPPPRQRGPPMGGQTRHFSHAQQGEWQNVFKPAAMPTQERNHPSKRERNHTPGKPAKTGMQLNPPPQTKRSPGKRQGAFNAPDYAQTGCPLCGNFGHSPFDCRARHQTCYNCHEQGHFGRVCPR